MASSEEKDLSTSDGQNVSRKESDVTSSLEETDKPLEESSEAPGVSEKLDVSTGEDNIPISKTNAKREKLYCFKSFTSSAQRIFKGLKSPKRTKGPPTRPICSSDVTMEPSSALLPSPIKSRETSPDLWVANPIDIRVDRIDYANLAEDEIIPTFLSSRTCYDAMPDSGKFAVLSVELLVEYAFEAFVTNEFRAALLWDFSRSSFVGMLTMTDFINVLRHYYRNSPESINDIESQSITTWRTINRTSKPVVKINATDNLAQAAKLLIEEGVHRIPVMDSSGQCRDSLTKKNLLNYLYNNIMQGFGNSNMKTPSFLTKTIKELGVGTFSDIATVTFDTTVIEAFDLFVQRKVSGLPIVDENNTLQDFFTKFNVFALAKEKAYHNLDMTINEAIEIGKVLEKVCHGCALDDTLGNVIKTIVTKKAHRLVVMDEKKSVLGIVSLSDILKFLVVQPLNKLEDTSTPPTDTLEEAPEGAVGGTETDDVFLEAKTKSGEDPSPVEPPDGAEAEDNNSKSNEDSVAEKEE